MTDMYGFMQLVDETGDAFWLVMCFGRPSFQDVVSSHDIGRDSWVWGEQETLYMMNSPHEVGEESLTERSSLSGGNGVAPA